MKTKITLCAILMLLSSICLAANNQTEIKWQETVDNLDGYRWDSCWQPITTDSLYVQISNQYRPTVLIVYTVNGITQVLIYEENGKTAPYCKFEARRGLVTVALPWAKSQLRALIGDEQYTTNLGENAKSLVQNALWYTNLQYSANVVHR